MRMTKTFVVCAVTNAPPQFVGSAMISVAPVVLILTLVGMKLRMLHHNSLIRLYLYIPPMLQYTLYYLFGTQSQEGDTVVH